MNILDRVPLTSELTLYPCPVTLVTCADKCSRNVITVSWAGIACSRPEFLTVAIKPSRFSYGIIAESGEFCLNIPSTRQVREVDLCGTTSGREVDKFALCGFHTIDSSRIRAPQIVECPVSIECAVTEILKLGEHHLFVARVLHKSIAGACATADGGHAPDSLDPIVYIRPNYYTLAGTRIGQYGYTRKGL